MTSAPRRPRAALRPRGDVVLVVAAGGALGSLARWGVGELIPWTAPQFPWATLLVNLTGCLLLGALMVLVLDVLPPRRYLRPFLGIGVLGGYTTFSTAMLETRDLLAAGEAATAMAYVSASLVAGMLAVWLGIASARFAVRAARRRSRTPDPHDRTGAPMSRSSS